MSRPDQRDVMRQAKMLAAGRASQSSHRLQLAEPVLGLVAALCFLGGVAGVLVSRDSLGAMLAAGLSGVIAGLLCLVAMAVVRTLRDIDEKLSAKESAAKHL